MSGFMFIELIVLIAHFLGYPKSIALKPKKVQSSKSIELVDQKVNILTWMGIISRKLFSQRQTGNSGLSATPQAVSAH